MTHVPFSLDNIEAAIVAATDGYNPEHEPELEGCEVARYQHECDQSYYVHIFADNSDLLMCLLELADRGDLADNWSLMTSRVIPGSVWFGFTDHLGRTSLVHFTLFPEIEDILANQPHRRIRFGPGVALEVPDNHVELTPKGQAELIDLFKRHNT